MGPQAQEAMNGSIDHLQEIEEGDETALNTRAFRYAYFFNRIKREVSRQWRAAEAHRRNDPTGRRFGVQDRLTLLSLTLNADGSLAEIELVKGSGLGFLDQAAMRAFYAAQPFPNPPPGLIEEDGKIRFRFGFFLEISSGSFRFAPSL